MDVKKIKIFKYELKTFVERQKYVESLLSGESGLLESYIDQKMCEDKIKNRSRSRKEITNITIEQLGTYLFSSTDKESCRSGEYSFYENELRYRQYAIGKNSYPTDFTREGEYMSTDFIKRSPILSEIDFKSRFNLTDMSFEQKRKMIKEALPLKDDMDFIYRNVMFDMYEYVIHMLEGNERDIELINLMMKGLTESEIASLLNINQSNVNRRIKKILTDKI